MPGSHPSDPGQVPPNKSGWNNKQQVIQALILKVNKVAPLMTDLPPAYSTDTDTHLGNNFQPYLCGSIDDKRNFIYRKKPPIA